MNQPPGSRALLSIVATVLVMMVPYCMCGNGRQTTDFNKTVKFISGGDYEDTVLIEGMKLKQEFTYFTQGNASLCACTRICNFMASCNGFSIGSDKECRISSLPPHDMTFETEEGAMYLFKLDSMQGEVNGLYGDHRLYFVGFDKLEFFEAVAKCNSIPGYQLAMFKTEKQFKALWAVRNQITFGELWVNLLNDEDWCHSTSGICWADGTPSDNDIMSQHGFSIYDNPFVHTFMLKPSGRFADRTIYERKQFICCATVV